MTLTLSKYAIQELIIELEVTSRQVYESRYTKPVWPGGVSGITIGLGYDIGHATQEGLQSAWQGILQPHEVNRLLPCCGVLGVKSKKLLPIDVKISWDQACKNFYRYTLPKYARTASRIYDELETLHPWEQTAIVGLVYNRGGDLKGDRRREMYQLIDAIKNDNDKLMASLIRQMKRLWSEGQKGLRLRRDKEAQFIDAPDHPLHHDDLLFIEV